MLPHIFNAYSFCYFDRLGWCPINEYTAWSQKQKRANNILANSFMLLIVISFVIMILSYIFKDKMLWSFGASPDSFKYANDYFSIYLLGTLFSFLSLGLNPFIVCQGFGKIGMLSIVLGAVSNIILDPIFIFTFNMGVKGAAIATVLSQLISCLFIVSFLFSKKPAVSISFGGYKLDTIKRILKVGATPFFIIFLDNYLLVILNDVLQSYGGAERGDMLITCGTIVQSFMSIAIMPVIGLADGTQGILGYNYGAGKSERVIEAEKFIMFLCASFAIVMMILIHTVSPYFISFFTTDKEYIDFTFWALKAYTIGLIPLAFQCAAISGFTGMGLAKEAFVFSMFRKLILYLSIIFIPKYYAVDNVFYAETISDFVGPCITLLVFFVLLKKILYKRECEIGIGSEI